MSKVSTSKSDVWSYGVVLWEIFAFGRAPYPRMGQKEVVDAVLKGYRMECPEACPKEVYDLIIMVCWEIDPVKRPTFKVCVCTLWMCEFLSPYVLLFHNYRHPHYTHTHALTHSHRHQRVAFYPM